MEARAKIEEDLFTRVPLSKTERRRQKATSRSANNALAHVGDFGDDVADLVEAAEAMDDAAPSRGRARLADAVASAGVAKVTKAPKPVGGEEDVPLRDSLGVRTRPARDELGSVFPPPASFEASMTPPPWSLGVKNDARWTEPARPAGARGARRSIAGDASRTARRFGASLTRLRRRHDSEAPNLPFLLIPSSPPPPRLAHSLARSSSRPSHHVRLIIALIPPPPPRLFSQDRRNKYERGVNRKQAQRAAAAASGMYDANDSREFVSEDPAYEAAETARDARRAAKEAKYARRPGVVAAMEEEMDGEDAKRDVGKKIMANRGLTPHRNKDHKNPRKRLRGKFEKAVVRRKGQVRSMREDAGGYGGEASGIKTSVTKSRRF